MDNHPLPFTDDLLLEILSRLPVKSLLRFQCVSKAWHALISSPTSKKLLPPAMAGLFFNGGYSYNRNKFISLQSRTHADASSIDGALSFLPSTDNIQILDCCRGLLLLSNTNCNSLLVCNPATRRWAHVSKPSADSGILVLSCNPHCSTHYDIVSFPLPDKAEEVEVFSSKTCEWTNIKEIKDLINQVRLTNARVVSLDGILYILDVHDGCTFSLDLQRKVCEPINGPYDLCVWINRYYARYACCFGISRGLLHFAFILSGEMHVWVLEDPGSNSYIVKHRASISDILGKVLHGKNHYCHVDILAFHSDLDLIFLQAEEMLYSYHLVTAKLEGMLMVRGKRPYFAYSPCYSEGI